MKWTFENIPNLADKTFIVTGANSGLGYWNSLYLAKKEAQVIMACRNLTKGENARAEILKEIPSGNLQLMTLDLSDLSSIKEFAQNFQNKLESLDGLINNAGVMALPYCQTKDGFEMQLGTNHLGHFALTGQLLPVLLKTSNSRIVNVSSMAHKFGKMNFEDLMSEKKYEKWTAYGQSKLANLLFAFELQRKFEAHNVKTISTGAHPGYSSTNLQSAGPKMSGSNLQEKMMSLSNALFAQSAERGSLPQLYAAIASDVSGGKYYGPDGLFAMRGFPREERPASQALNKESAARLWEISEELTGITYNFS